MNLRIGQTANAQNALAAFAPAYAPAAYYPPGENPL